jgi:RimJ/RimL family protein N-acetyltransferase
MEPILETERLKLRPFTKDDAAFIIELLNSPGWLQFIGDRNVRTEEQAVSYLQNGPMKSYLVNGFGLSCVERKEDGLPVGMCGIIRRDNLEHPDIGFALLPQFEGRGYGFEIANATMKHAREALQFSKISAITLPENTNSIRLLEKLGLSFIERFTFPGGKEELLLYSN